MFFSCDVHEGLLYATVKVPRSGRELLKQPWAEPTHYGMGKYGWVTLKLKTGKEVTVDEMRAWIDETFMSMAPKKLVAARAKAAADFARGAHEAPVKAKAKPGAKPGAKPKAGAKAKAAAKPKISTRAILVCADKLRSQRAVDEYAARGVGLDVVATAAELKLGKARALVVDIGRNPVDGIALAQRIDASDKPVHLFIAGVRDADQLRKLRDLGSAECFRGPAGDAKVADAVAAALTKSSGGARRAP